MCGIAATPAFVFPDAVLCMEGEGALERDGVTDGQKHFSGLTRGYTNKL